jgi:hypothetical protein
MFDVQKLAECGKKKCGKHVPIKKIRELEEKLGPVKNECFDNKKSRSLLSVDECLSKSNDYLEMKKIMKKSRESVTKCIKKKCMKPIKKTKSVRPRSSKRRKPRSRRKVQK